MIFCSLYSGSSGNSIFLSSGSANILIDAGLSGKSIDKALNDINVQSKDIDGIFVTHEHSDHTKGVGILSRKYNIPIYANEQTWNAMAPALGNIKDENIKIIHNGSVSIKDLDITSFNISHDAASPCGYSIHHGNKKACIATDLGYFTSEVKNAIIDADLVLLESNHDVEMLKFGPYPYPLKRRVLSNLGHLSNEDCGNAIVSITNEKYKRIILGHLSNTNNYPDLAFETVRSILVEEKIAVNKDLELTIAKRSTPSNYIEF